MPLSLDSEELEILSWALTQTISELGHEIADTERQDLREDLKHRKKILQGILTRLSSQK